MPNNYVKIHNLNSLSVSIPRWDGTIEYSLDLLTWTPWDGTGTLLSNDNNDLYLRGIGNTVITNGLSSNHCWSLSGTDIQVTGDIENLLDYSTVANSNHPTMGAYCYAYMFYGCRGLTSAPTLGAVTLTDYCYQGMFYECTSLSTPPALPATSLADYCYSNMFRGCISLTTASVLSATTLADYCYYCMFRDCISITTSPQLSVMELSDGCYDMMFYGCTGLMFTPELPATALADYCYYYMFYGCTRLVAPSLLPALDLPDSCYEGMFNGCINIKLSNTTSAHYSTEYRIPSVGTGTTGQHSLFNMFLNTGGPVSATPTINTTYYLKGIAPYTPIGNVTFKYGYKSEYDSLITKESNVMYVLIDTQEIYIGEQKYSDGAMDVTVLPLNDGTNRVLSQILPKVHDRGNKYTGILLVTESQYTEMINSGTVDNNILYLLYENSTYVTDIVVSTVDDNIALTAEGIDLPDDGDYTWGIYFDDDIDDLSSVGPQIVLNSEYTTKYNEATIVRVAVSVLGYASDYYTVKS